MGGSPSRKSDKANVVILDAKCHQRIHEGDWGNAIITDWDGSRRYRVFDLHNVTIAERVISTGQKRRDPTSSPKHEPDSLLPGTERSQALRGGEKRSDSGAAFHDDDFPPAPEGLTAKEGGHPGTVEPLSDGASPPKQNTHVLDSESLIDARPVREGFEEEETDALSGLPGHAGDRAVDAAGELPYSPVLGAAPTAIEEEHDALAGVELADNGTIIRRWQRDRLADNAPIDSLDNDTLALYFQQCMRLSGTAYLEGCRAVAVYRDRALAAGEKFWAESATTLFGRSRRTLYSLASLHDAHQRLSAVPALAQYADEIASLPTETLRLVAAQDEPERAFEVALAQQATMGEASVRSVAHALQSEGALPMATTEVGCPCGCDWWGSRSSLLKRGMVE